MKSIKDYFNHDITVEKLNAISNKHPLSENAQWLLEQRYLATRYDTEIQELRKERNFAELVRRVSRVIASAETLYTDDVEWIRTLEKNIAADMLSKRFCFNSPCLFNAGVGMTTDNLGASLIYRPIDEMTFGAYKTVYECRQKNQQLFACFVIDVPDSIDGIFNSVKDAAIISKYGGGVGASFGHIRERGAKVHDGGNGGVASGPVSFMRTWDTMADVVVQGGKRRAALMGMLPIDHPDIEEFINCKTEDGKLPYFNISVALTDEFMNTVTSHGKALFDKLCKAAWERGDPGVFFVDTANNDSLLKNNPDYRIESTNPCGEQPLPNYTSCNLGSINVSEFVIDDDFDWDELDAQIMRSMYYLDLVIDASVYPLEKIEQRTKAIRPVGLGIMGLADAFIKQGIVYGLNESKSQAKGIAQQFSTSSLAATTMIADIKGIFPTCTVAKDFFNDYVLTKDDNWVENAKMSEYDLLVGKIFQDDTIPTSLRNAINTLDAVETWSNRSEYMVLEHVIHGKLRNSRRLSIAPTGSISMLFDTSHGIEPNFAWHWTRKVTTPDGGVEEREYWHPLLGNSQKHIIRIGKKITDSFFEEDQAFVTAHEVTPDQHVEMAGVFAPYIDSGISKTVNLPHDATVEDVKKVYLKAYKLGLKGITVYRDGSRSTQPIETKPEKKAKNCGECVSGCLGEDCAYRHAGTCNGCDVNDDENDVRNAKSKNRPALVTGQTIKDTTPWGSLYVTLSRDDEGNPIETFISVGKSGSELKAMLEALARVISIGLQSGCKLEAIIKTLRGLSGKEYWCMDVDDNQVVRSIPDAVALLLNKLLAKNDSLKPTPKSSGVICPECGSPMELIAGCAYCYTCGYSPCK